MGNKHTPSIREIAAKAGVSTATVSRVLNKKGGYSLETERLVLDIVNKNSYSLPRKDTEKTIGILIQDITNEWFAQTAAHLERALYRNGYGACIYNTNESVEKTEWYFDECMRQRFAGMIIVSPMKEIAEKAQYASLPIVFIDRTPVQKENLLSIEYDHYLGGYMASEYLIRKGCRRIMFLGLEEDNPAIDARFRGYQDALTAYDLPLAEELVINLNDNHNLYESAYNMVYYLLKKKLDFQGIFATNDMRALGTLRALQQNGIRVPEEVRLIGFDDIPRAKQCYPALTTIRQDPQELAETSVDMLLNQIHSPGSNTKHHLILPVSLAERGTA